MQIWVKRLQRAQHLGVILPLERRVQPAHNVDFGDPQLQRLLRFLDHFRQVVLVRAGIAPPPVERAEIAIEDADVGVIDVTIQDVVGDVAVLALPHRVCHRADGRQIL